MSTDQTQRVLKRLQQGTLTQSEAFRELGVGRLSARILELRKAGYNIKTDMVTFKNRYGDRSTVAVYQLIQSGSIAA